MAHTTRAFSFAALCTAPTSSSAPHSPPRPTRKKTKSTPRRPNYCVSSALASGSRCNSCVFDEKFPTARSDRRASRGRYTEWERKRDATQGNRCWSWSNWLRRLGGRTGGNYDLLEKLPLPRESIQQI